MEKTERKPAPAATDDKARGTKFKRPKRKVCQFCVDKVKDIDYKDVNKLKKYTTEKGKIVARRQSGLCAKHQRELTVSIKRSRCMALMPFKND